MAQIMCKPCFPSLSNWFLLWVIRIAGVFAWLLGDRNFWLNKYETILAAIQRLENIKLEIEVGS